MQKCLICIIGSWIVGLATVSFSVVTIFDLSLPAGTLAGASYVVLILVAAGFLYYQIVPCPRCTRKNKGESQ